MAKVDERVLESGEMCVDATVVGLQILILPALLFILCKLTRHQQVSSTICSKTACTGACRRMLVEIMDTLIAGVESKEPRSVLQADPIETGARGVF